MNTDIKQIKKEKKCNDEKNEYKDNKVDKIPFYLRSETKDIQKGMCLSCHQSNTYKIESVPEVYSIYKCWNKNCEKNGIPFAIIHKYIYNEYKFNPNCPDCRKPFKRRLVHKNDKIILKFYCESKMCVFHSNPYRYDLTEDHWMPDIPDFMPKYFDWNKGQKFLSKKVTESIIKSESKKEIFCKDNSVPLLSMQKKQYQKFLDHHNNKVLIMVDVPNFVRTMRDFCKDDFESQLTKTHRVLLDVMKSEFGKEEKYIVRYFSNPQYDLVQSNGYFKKFCCKSNREFFHNLKIKKMKDNRDGWSDVDSYLITAAMNVISDCNLEGLIFVSDDKDYLPAALLSKKSGVKPIIFGINPSHDYIEYDIDVFWYLDLVNESADSGNF